MGLHRKDVPELRLLQVIRDRRAVPGLWRHFPHELLDMPEKLIERKMEQLERRGYLDVGVSLRTGWLTEAGVARLRELEAVRGTTD